MSSSFLSEANKLKNIQKYLEKNDNLLHFSKYSSECDLSEYFVELEITRKSETDQTIKELKDIWKLLDGKKKILQQEDLNAIDLRSFKKDMIELQEKIHTLKIKLKANIEVLKDEENNISEINNTYNQRLTEWEKPIRTFSKNIYAVNRNLCTNNTNKEVKEFMDFVNKSNGHENGWSSEDHQLFLKFRKKCKNVDDLAINLNKLLPDISINAVKEHDKWFRKYLLLKNKKEEILQKWRESKNENIEHRDVDSVDVNKNMCKSRSYLKTKDENVQEQIALWKEKKEEKRRQERIAEEIRKEKRNRLEEKKKHFHNEVKEAVAKWKEAKVTKIYYEKVQKELMDYREKRMRALEANKMIKKFQSQDDIFITRMRSSKLSKKNEIIRSKSSYLVHRDPDRILKPTKQWLLRTSKDNFVDDGVSSYVPNIREIPKLRVPEWRKNTSVPS